MTVAGKTKLEGLTAALDELAALRGRSSECQIGEMTLAEYGGSTVCFLVVTSLANFVTQRDFAVYGAEIIKIFNSFFPELAQDPFIVEVYGKQGVAFVGRALIPLAVLEKVPEGFVHGRAVGAPTVVPSVTLEEITARNYSR